MFLPLRSNVSEPVLDGGRKFLLKDKNKYDFGEFLPLADYL